MARHRILQDRIECETKPPLFFCQIDAVESGVLGTI
jgi:hypothetical protein